jgi:hypothetical protein
MKTKPHAAFGYVLLEQSFVDGESYFAEVSAGAKNAQLWVKGRFNNKNVTLNEPHEPFEAGMFIKPSDYITGLFEHTVVGDTTFFCFPRQDDKGEMPELNKFFIGAGQSTSLPKGTKLFHCHGEISINGSLITNPAQIRSATNSLNISAITDCYGIIFE